MAQHRCTFSRCEFLPDLDYHLNYWIETIHSLNKIVPTCDPPKAYSPCSGRASWRHHWSHPSIPKCARRVWVHSLFLALRPYFLLSVTSSSMSSLNLLFLTRLSSFILSPHLLKVTRTIWHMTIWLLICFFSKAIVLWAQGIPSSRGFLEFPRWNLVSFPAAFPC